MCVVTFSSFDNRPTLDRPGFGEAFFAGRRIAAVHVVSRENRWYQDEDLPAALAAARAVASRYGRVLSYGSSMGGFGAIRFGAAAGAQVALAISPQSSIDPREVPFERRWELYSRTIRFRHDAASLPKVGRVVVVYDPRDLDVRHADRIAAEYPTDRVRIPYAGHPVGAYLAETGLLAEAVEAVCGDRFDAPSFEREARRRRRRSGQYLFALGRRLGTHHLATKLALARLAVEAVPPDTAYRSFLGIVSERCGLWPEAEEQYRLTTGPQAETADYLERFARALLRRARVAEAADLLARARRLAPESTRSRRTEILVRLAEGKDLLAWRLFIQAARREPRHVGTVLREIWAVWAWRAAGLWRGQDGGTMPIPFGPELTGGAPERR